MENQPSVQPPNDTPTFVFGMMMGFLVGSILAVWMAPRSGKKTRDDIRHNVITLRLRAGNSVKQVVEKVQGESVEDSIEQGKAIAHQKKAELADRVNGTTTA
ncbi:MAG: YtxH domain-containing protein [Chloroflexi bacterium]|nr:YtxH domain-containing protein [Chloroflexota bacterium]